MSVFNFTVLLSYHVIHVFLVEKFNCPATHGHVSYHNNKVEIIEPKIEH
jgi:hypothetical protein